MLLEERIGLFLFHHRRKVNKGVHALWAVFRTLLFIGLGFVLLYPVIYMMSIAFRPVSELSDPSVIWIPKSFTLTNFKETFKALGMPQTLYTTVLISLLCAALQMVSCSLAGYGFARFRFAGRNLLFGVVIFSIIVPMQTLILPTYAEFKNFDIFGLFGLINTISGVDLRVNLLDTLWVYILPSLFGMGIRGGLFIFIFRQAFRGMPKELEEAAAIDGCGRFKTFYKIMVPMSGPTYLTLSLSLKAVGVQVFDPFELTTRLQSGCFIMIVPLLIMYIFLQKYFVEGVERTGITG